MVIWINGAFGAGKSTVSGLLAKQLPCSNIFDPEFVGCIIRKTFPATSSMDYQDLAMWRKLTGDFIVESKKQFNSSLIIPMTLVVPQYLQEVFGNIATQNLLVHHFFLDVEKEVLQQRISNQSHFENGTKQSDDTKRWRINQIDRCDAAKALLPEETVFLNANNNSTEQLVSEILSHINSMT